MTVATVTAEHARLDARIEAWRQHQAPQDTAVFCREGCAGCCSMAVHATLPEAAAIAGLLDEPLVEALDAYLQRLSGILAETADMPGYLKAHRQVVGACPFLADGRCLIYSKRPAACRALLSTRPAEWCVVDFGSLDPWDKQMYENGLNRSVVAWPTHYVQATQDFGRQAEDRLSESHSRQAGWTVSGNLPVLVWLARRGLAEDRVLREKSACARCLAERNFAKPFLVQFS